MSEAKRTILVLKNYSTYGNPDQQLLQQDADFTWEIVDDANAPLSALCQTLCVDGILLELPEIDTRELRVLEQLKGQLGQACPPVITIGENDLNTAVAAFKAGATDYLVRDQLTPDALCLAFRTAIENAELKRELQLSHEQFQTSVENMLDCFGIFSAIRDDSGLIVDFRIDYLNDAACANNRMTREQHLGGRLCELLPGHRESGLFDEYCQLVETGEPLVKESLIYEDLFDGERLARAFDIRANKLNDGFVVFWRDITDGKQLELELSQTVATLQQQQTYLQQLLNTAPIGVGIGLPSGEVRIINDAMLALHGLTRDDFERDGMNWCDFTPPEYVGRIEPAMTQLQQQGFLPPEEKEILRPDGSRVPVWISATQDMDNPGDHVAFAVDLTAQKQAEAALKASQQRYQELAEAMPQMVWQADATGAVNYWNQRWYDYTGLSEAASFDLGGAEVLHPADRNRTLAQWQQANTEGEDFEIEHRIRRQDGAYRWFINRGIPTRDSHGHITGWIGTITDIEEQKRLEERLQLVLRAVDSLVYDWNLETNEIYRSEQLLTLAGYYPDEVPAKPEWWFDQMHPDDRARLQARAQEVMTGSDEPHKTDLLESEYRVRHKNGQWVHVWDRSCLVRDHQGQLTRVVGSTMDISKLKQAEITLQHNQERLNLAMQAAGIGTWDLNLLTQEVHWSDNLQQLFGMEPGSFDGRFETVMAMIHPEDLPMVQTSIRQAVEEGADYNIEFRFIKPDGTMRWALGLGRVFYNADGQPVEMTGVDMDITDRKQAERELHQATERLNTALKSAPISLFSQDAELRYTWIYNPSAPFSADDILDRRDRDLVSTKSAQYLTQLKQQVLDTGVTLREEIKVTVGERTQHFDLIIDPIWDETDTIIGITGAAVDISERIQLETERQQAQAELAANEARLRGFVESNVVGILYGDIYGGIAEANDEFLRMVGYTRTDLQARQVRWDALTPPEYLPLDEERIAEARNRGACTPYEKEYIRKDGSRLPVLLGYSLVGEDQEETVAFVLDLSDRKQAERRLQESEEHLQLGMQVSGFALAQVDYSTNRVTLSPEAAALYGLSPDQLIISREQLQDTFHPEDQPQLEQLIQTTLDPAGAGWFAQDHRVISNTGEVKWLTVRKQVFFDRSSSPPQPSHAILVALDITERKQAEMERARLLQREQAAREAAENANRVKDEFLAILSHELRSPLNPILGWANLLQTKKLDAAKTARALATIERNAKLQTQLIDDLLDVARILRGKLKLEKMLVDPAFVIESALETVQSAAAEKQISIQTELSAVGQIRVDTGRLQQIVWNLLTNAVKFTPAGGRVEVRLEQVEEREQGSELQGDRVSGARYQVSGTRNQLPPETSLSPKPDTRNPVPDTQYPIPNTQYAQITVSDTGMGIRQDFLPHIFESFRQEDTSVTRQFGGLGLGLAIVRYLVEAHGGTIAADSPGEGQGATFTVKLPLIGGGDPRAAVKQPSATNVDLTGVRVLAVDDNPDALELLTIALQTFRAEVQSVARASEVVAALASFKPMVLLCDIGMPNMDGHALMQQIRALPPEQGGQVPAIAVTAYVREADHQKALDSGFQKHIAKPIALEALAIAVAELVGKALGE